MIALPSRTEGFGLVALEAISAGIPVLVASESGIAEALQEVDGGQSFVVESDDPEVWARRIQQLSIQSPEERENSTKLLRENYNNTYPWSKECERFKRMIQDLLSGTFMMPFSGFEKIILPWGSLALLHFYFVGSQFACSSKIGTGISAGSGRNHEGNPPGSWQGYNVYKL